MVTGLYRLRPGPAFLSNPTDAVDDRLQKAQVLLAQWIGVSLTVSAAGHHHGAAQYLGKGSGFGRDEDSEQVRIRVIEQPLLLDPHRQIVSVG